MKLLVCGGRDYQDRAQFNRVMGAICDEFDLNVYEDQATKSGNFLPLKLHIIAGGAKGADAFAAEFAAVSWTGYTEFEADWKEYGLRAGPIRNQRMLDEGKPDLVIAFPGGRGTADMITRARKAGVPVRVIEEVSA